MSEFLLLLFEEPLTETAKARLKVIFEHSDGFEIYKGTHTSAVADRFQNHVIPFFAKNLCQKAPCRTDRKVVSGTAK